MILTMHDGCNAVQCLPLERHYCKVELYADDQPAKGIVYCSSKLSAKQYLACKKCIKLITLYEIFTLKAETDHRCTGFLRQMVQLLPIIFFSFSVSFLSACRMALESTHFCFRNSSSVSSACGQHTYDNVKLLLLLLLQMSMSQQPGTQCLS